MKKKISILFISAVLTTLLSTQCFAAELQDTQVIFALIDKETDTLVGYSIFDYKDAKIKEISEAEYFEYLASGYEAEEINEKALEVIQIDAAAEIYGGTGWGKFLPQATTITDVSEIPDNISRLSEVRDSEGNLHYMYYYNGLYYEFGEQVYLQYQREVEMTNLESETEKNLSEADARGEGIIYIDASAGIDVNKERLYFTIYCIDTLEQYSVYITPPDYSAQITLPVGSYLFSECGSMRDSDVTYHLSGDISFTVKVGEEISLDVKIGNQITAEDLSALVHTPTDDEMKSANNAVSKPVETLSNDDISSEEVIVGGESVEKGVGKLLNQEETVAKAKSTLNIISIVVFSIVFTAVGGLAFVAYKRYKER